MEPEIWEVELKFHLDNARLLASRLNELDFVASPMQSHEDIYFRHPSRDFKATDEALRFRRIDQSAYVPYKGPRRKGPVKTREEIELSVDETENLQWQTLLARLGFQPLPAVRKLRREFKSQSPEWAHLTVVIDQVEGLGEFAEIEMVVTDADGLEAAQSEVLVLAERLGLRQIQPRSYLDQLLELHGP